MTLSQWRVLTTGLFLLGACGGGAAKSSPAGGAGVSAVNAAGAAGTSAGTAGGASAAGASAIGTTAGAGSAAGNTAELPDGGAVVEPLWDSGVTADDPCDYEMEAVNLAADLVIPVGETVHVCAGVTFTAAKDVKVDVLGQLIVDGSEAAPVSFLGSAAQPRSWHGVVIESGGKLQLTHTKIGGAIYGMYAMPGAAFAVDESELGTSFKAAVLESAGTFTNTKFVASAPPTIAVTDAVTVDDPNGAVTMIDASPSFSNCRFDGASPFTDLVRVGGESSATFDHVYLHGAHCGFHTSGGTNTSIHITNSIIEGMSYGLMAYTTKPIIENSVFQMNGNDVGQCTGATKDNTPVLMNNFYAKGSPTVDASCFMIGTTDPTPAAAAAPGAGATGL